MKKYLMFIVLLVTSSQIAYAYKWINYNSDGSYYGECNNGRSFSGYPYSADSHLVTGPSQSGVVSQSQSEAIRKACGE